MFIFSKKADGNFALFTYYVNNFKIAADGTLSYTTNSLYYDNTTANSDFDAASAWTDGATLSLSGAELDGMPHVLAQRLHGQPVRRHDFR